MNKRQLRDYKGWLKRPTSYMKVDGIHRISVVIKDSFCELFEEFCSENELQCEQMDDGFPFGDTTNYLVEYVNDSRIGNVQGETIDDQLADLPYVFADYLKERYGDIDPRLNYRSSGDQRSDFMRRQKNRSIEDSAPLFMPEDGKCFKCKGDVIAAEIGKGNFGDKLVTSCPICSTSYCN